MILKGEHIVKSFGNQTAQTPVLKDVSLELKTGEFVAIMGKSGSGKSTLLNILSTLDRCDQGQVFFENREISHLDDQEAAQLRLKQFGFVFQLPRMIKNLNVLENILLPSLTYQKDQQTATREALAIMEEIGIADLAQKRISEISGGQLQRAGICRALINKPKLLFADEPTGALDSKSGQEVMELLKRYHQTGQTILLVTHDVTIATKAQRVLLMKDGQIQENVQLTREEGDNHTLLQQIIEQL